MPQAGVVVSPREKEAERATISGRHEDDGSLASVIPRTGWTRESGKDQSLSGRVSSEMFSVPHVGPP